MKQMTHHPALVGLLLGGSVCILGLLACPQAPPNPELIDLAHDAVQMAEDAHNEQTSALLWAGRYRVLGLCIGLAVPMGVAWLIWKSANESVATPEDLVEILQTHTPIIPSSKRKTASGLPRDAPDPSLESKPSSENS